MTIDLSFIGHFIMIGFCVAMLSTVPALLITYIVRLFRVVR